MKAQDFFNKLKELSKKKEKVVKQPKIMSDKKLFIIAAALLILPLTLAFFGGDRFRYPCQDPDNWEKEICKMPKCDVTRTCPEHIFKGQRDPRLGPPTIKVEPISISQAPAPAQCTVPNQGVSCGK